MKAPVLQNFQLMVFGAMGDFLHLDEIPEENSKPVRNLYQRRAYAARRALMAIDKISSLANTGAPVDKEATLRWMKLWMNFATANDN
jgi:hypothetical protein